MTTKSGWPWMAVALAASVAQAQEPELARGAELLVPFKRDLQQALRKGLAEGPVEAIAACQIRAPEIAAKLSRDGVRVGRSSLRLRNPANEPPEWVRPVLEAYVASPSKRVPSVVSLPNTRWGYVEPIATQPVCLTCHGETLAPEVASRIEVLYPEDRAVGFRLGDLRGVFWVEFPEARPDEAAMWRACEVPSDCTWTMGEGGWPVAINAGQVSAYLESVRSRAPFTTYFTPGDCFAHHSELEEYVLQSRSALSCLDGACSLEIEPRCTK